MRLTKILVVFAALLVYECSDKRWILERFRVPDSAQWWCSEGSGMKIKQWKARMGPNNSYWCSQDDAPKLTQQGAGQ